MAVETLTLTEFLLARLAEDETSARDLAADAMVGAPWKHFPKDAYDEIRDMALILAHRMKVDARVKRRIVERCQMEIVPPGESLSIYDAEAYTDAMASNVLEFLALPYADHEDYNPDWRP